MIIQPLPENICYFQIVEVFLEPMELWLKLEIINPINPTELIKLKLDEMAYFSISKTPEDSEGCYQILDIQLSLWEDMDALYKKVNYKFYNTPKIRELYYLYIEGDICLDVVSKSCAISRQQQ